MPGVAFAQASASIAGLVRNTSGAGLALQLAASALPSAQDGATAYQQRCASCHDAGADRAPNREAFRAMSPA
jgi:cytochrome c5